VDSFSIGLSGLSAAQKALDVIGNNVANAATDGYHRQRIELTPERTSQVGSIILGGGVDVVGVTRMIDSLLEVEILRQQSSLGQVSQELATLRTVENAFGELSASGGLSAAIDEFFNALRDLSAHPAELIWQTQAVTAAETMTGQFRTLGEFLASLEAQITLEAQNTIQQVNVLTGQIAKLNDEIERMEITGGQANNLRDQRDQCIAELAELIGVETNAREYGVVDVYAGGIPVVIGTFCSELEVGLQEDGSLGISIAGSYSYTTNVQGGRLGGLLSLKNSILADVQSDVDDLAGAIIEQINQYHVQGVGSDGSFTELTGWQMASENLADFDPPITSGSVFIRVTDTTVPGTTTITRHEIDIANDLPANPTLSDLADYITNNITGLTASVVSSKLSISAGANYKFDFLPGVLSEPTTSNLNGDAGASIPTVTISGIYTGTASQTYTCTVVGDGEVGNDDNLKIEVKVGTDVIKTLDVGSYAAGDRLEIGDGIYVSVGAGQLNNGEIFTIEALANSDTSGVLAAVGINTFFSGSGAADMAVCSDIAASPSRVAVALGGDMTDNANALRLAGLKDQAVSSLNGMTAGEFYRKLVMDIGQELSIKQMREENIGVIVQNLAGQQGEISGVDINEEAARMLVFEQMFQAMAKYLNIVHSSLLTIMEIV
jgi:flagellar hook-associated protein 1 FlgK